MGIPKTNKYKMRSTYEKEQIVLENLEGHVTRQKLCDKYHLSTATIHEWITTYRQGGRDALVSNTGKSNKKK